ncbi:MAG: hypothetical protein AAFX04_03610 [Pseudomonadota bacterium]
MVATILSIMMLLAFALVIGALVLSRREGWTRKPVLMLVLAGIMFGNVAIWALPNDRGIAPVEAVAQN